VGEKQENRRAKMHLSFQLSRQLSPNVTTTTATKGKTHCMLQVKNVVIPYTRHEGIKGLKMYSSS